MRAVRRVTLAPGSAEVDDLQREDLLQLVAKAAGMVESPPTILANHNLHSLYFWYRDASVRAFFEEADYIHADGMSMVLLNRLLGGRELSAANRLAYLDFMDDVWQLAERERLRVFLLGGSESRNRRFAQWLAARYPGVRFDHYHGFFDVVTASPTVIERINTDPPDILLVGMGMPRQELWIRQHRPELRAGVVMTCGAYPDYQVGEIRTPPRWLGRLGLEWLFRLVTEPRRTAWRYLVEPWYIVYRLLGGIAYTLRRRF